MPELPEVETIRRIIERDVVGRELVSVELRLQKLVKGSPLRDLEVLIGRRIERVERRAKVLIVHWSGALSLLIHFKLAGQLAVVTPDGRTAVAGHPVPNPKGEYPHKSTHVTLVFGDRTIVYYSDIRQFGWWRLMPADDVDSVLALFRFGPEGIGTNDFTVSEFADRLGRRRISVKQALLDQKVIAGLGNIYVDEALHQARINPVRTANSLSPAEIGVLHEAIGWALARGIEQGGADIRQGRAYPIDGFPAVHARAGEPCSRCGAEIFKTRIGARGTYYCPVCQPVSA